MIFCHPYLIIIYMLVFQGSTNNKKKNKGVVLNQNIFLHFNLSHDILHLCENKDTNLHGDTNYMYITYLKLNIHNIRGLFSKSVIIYNVQDYSVLYNNSVLPVICECWHFTLVWKHLHDRIISLRGEVWVHKTSLNQSSCS